MWGMEKEVHWGLCVFMGGGECLDGADRFWGEREERVYRAPTGKSLLTF